MTEQSRIPNDGKLEELILYIAARSEGDSTFGITKLNKILFYADFLAYVQLGRAITWHCYQKLENGPAPRAMLPVLERMMRRGDVVIANRTSFGYKQKKVVALRDAQLGEFSGDEISLVDEIIERFRGKTARGVSDLSHKFIGWKYTGFGEDIPYEMALVRRGPPSIEAEKYGATLTEAARKCLTRERIESA